MSDITFDTYLDKLASGLAAAAWTTGAVRAALLDSQTWTPDKSDLFVATATGAGAVEVTAAPYARQVVGGKTKTVDAGGHRVLLGMNTIDFGAMAAGQNYNRLLLYTFVTNDADSWLIAALDLGALTTNGVDQRFVPNASGLYQIVAT